MRLTRNAARWCDPRPIGVRLRIWDGSRIEVAAAEDRMAVVGPNVAAAINDLPRDPVPARADNGRVASVMYDTSRSTTPVQRHSGSTAWAGMALVRRDHDGDGFVIPIDVLVIHALAAHGRELEAF